VPFDPAFGAVVLMMWACAQVKGLSWNSNAISNAAWTGVKLRDVLLWAGKADLQKPLCMMVEPCL
jgi:hypothetical protein